MTLRPLARLMAVMALMLACSASVATAQGFGVKVGPTFDEFSDEALDFENRTGIHAGRFVGGAATM